MTNPFNALVLLKSYSKWAELFWTRTNVWNDVGSVCVCVYAFVFVVLCVMQMSMTKWHHIGKRKKRKPKKRQLTCSLGGARWGELFCCLPVVPRAMYTILIVAGSFSTIVVAIGVVVVAIHTEIVAYSSALLCGCRLLGRRNVDGCY